MKNILSIFRKTEIAKAEETPETKLAAMLYGPAAPPAPPRLAMAAMPLPIVPETPPRPKVIFGVDATASREKAMATSAALTDALLAEMPGQLDVNLAVHGGGKLHTFTAFEQSVGKLRDRAARVRCKAGGTRLLDILARAIEIEGVGMVIYVGDTFEESAERAIELADALATRNIRLIVLHDVAPHAASAAGIFAEMASRTGGVVLPFDSAALPKLREVLSAIAVLAVGGTPMLAAKQETLPAARLLLQHLKGGKT